MFKHLEIIVILVVSSLISCNKGEVEVLTDNPDCYIEESHDYTGTRSRTKSGLECKRWDELEPYLDIYSDDEFPDGSKCKAKNYCRDPKNFGFLWCYTTDPEIPADECDVHPCDEQTGNNQTNDCYVITDKDRESGMSEKEICESKPGRTRVCEESKHAPPGCEDCEDCCQEKDCHPDCVRDYSGTWHRTKSGRQCQHWDLQWPHQHPHNESHMFPKDDSVSDAQNYCRDPDSSGSLWCYTEDWYERREECGIPEC